MYSYSNGAETNFSISGFSDNAAEATWSTTTLADVVYVNREDRVPWKLGASDSQFVSLSGWDSTWRCRLLRTCGSALVALNVTKGSSVYPTMVKTSSIPTAGNVPSSWDYTTLSTLSTENILAEMEGPITDASALGLNLYIYGNYETWRMTADGSLNVFSYVRAFKGRGSINANCSLEVNGKQYVFGPDDIWMHDGVSDQSIADGLVREFIYSTMNYSKRSRFFISHNPYLKEIAFHYVSADSLVRFSGAEGCNRAAVYNYVDGSWTFDDLPFVFGAARASVGSTTTWASGSSTWDTAGGAWVDLDDGSKRAFLYIGDANTTYGLSKRLYAYDLYGQGSTVSFPVDAAATKGMYLERQGIDLDELGKELRSFVAVNSIYPQARLDAAAAPLIFQTGASDTFGEDITWGDTQTYNGRDLYKLDFNDEGRWLGIRITFDDYRSLVLTGYDVDFKQLGKK